MKYALTLELPGLPKSLNGSHGHWSSKAAERRKWRTMSHRVAVSRRPPSPLTECEIVCTRFSSRPTDYDNLVASFKSVIDGLKDAGIFTDDNQSVITKREYKWEPAKASAGKITVLVVGSIQQPKESSDV